MNAIDLLRRTGLTTQQIADALACTTHAIRYYEQGKRFPKGKAYEAIVELASQRGVRLLADDFIDPGKAA